MRSYSIRFRLLALVLLFTANSVLAQMSGGLPPLKNQSPPNPSAPRTYAKSLKSIIAEKGIDYVVTNYQLVSKQIDDTEKVFLARILIRELRGSESPEILLPLARKDNVQAIRVLAENYGTGIDGFRVNETQAQIWTSRLEQLIKTVDDKQRRSITSTLCHIYEGRFHVLRNKLSEVRYCSEYFLFSEAQSKYAYTLLNPKSNLYDPQKGLQVYEKCIAQGDWVCKANYAWQGKQSVEIAKIATKRQLFEYASEAAQKNSGVAVNNLATFYEEGIGIPVDHAKAVELYDKAANQGTSFAIYNLLRYSFFKYYDWKSAPQSVEDVQALFSYYDYLSAENDRFDSVPFKDWIFSKKRMPSNQMEFSEFLEERAKQGVGASACMLAEHLVKTGDLGKALFYADLGKKSSHIFTKQWCEVVVAKAEVKNIMKP